MEVLEIGGVKYVKASAVARELGYTSDYVGQLCRAGKVKAQLVGRSWYVDRDSINDHKKTRYRSTKKKTTEALKSVLALSEDDKNKSKSSKINISQEGSIPQTTSKNFYSRDVVADSAKYTIDDSELIPILKEKRAVSPEAPSPKEVEVVHADAKKVEIRKTSNSFIFSTTAKPKIQFTGNITIAEVQDDASEEVSDDAVKPALESKKKEQTPEVKQRTSKKPSRLKGSKVSIRTLKDSNLNHLNVTAEGPDVEHVSVRKTVDGKSQDRAHEHKGGELVVHEVTENFEQTGGRYNFVYITASVALSLVVGLFLIAFEQSFTTAGVGLISSYSFNISTVLEAFELLK